MVINFEISKGLSDFILWKASHPFTLDSEDWSIQRALCSGLTSSHEKQWLSILPFEVFFSAIGDEEN